MKINTVGTGELNRAHRWFGTTICRHLEQFIETDFFHFARVRHDPRIGGEHSGDVGIELT